MFLSIFGYVPQLLTKNTIFANNKQDIGENNPWAVNNLFKDKIYLGNMLHVKRQHILPRASYEMVVVCEKWYMVGDLFNNSIMLISI